MNDVNRIMIDLFGQIEVTTAGTYYKPITDLIKNLQKISPQHYILFCQPYAESIIKKLADYFKIEYRVGKFLPKDIMAIIVDTDKIYPKIETYAEM